MLPSAFLCWLPTFRFGRLKPFRNASSACSAVRLPAAPYVTINDDCWSGDVITTRRWSFSKSVGFQLSGYCTLNGAPEPVYVASLTGVAVPRGVLVGAVVGVTLGAEVAVGELVGMDVGSGVG